MTTPMTSRERVLAAFRREPVDRVPFRIWGFDPEGEHPEPTFAALAEIARAAELDVMNFWSPRVHEASESHAELETRPSRHEGFVEEVWTRQTPRGPLVQCYLRSLVGKPGYQSKYLLETPEDAARWLSLPWSPPVVDCSDWPAAEARLGSRGLLMAGGIGEAMYAINGMTGSECWGYWLVEERELLHELVAEASRRELYVLKEMLAQGVRGVYGYVGPELCIPPLAGPRDFDEFVVPYDQPVHDLIHEAGGSVWLHCHGKMNLVLERFADEGIDCLNPMEPPPMGDVTIAEARARVGDRMALEGGIEVGDLELKGPAEMEAMTSEALWQSGGRGFILSFSSDLSHLLTLTPHVLENLRVFCEVARRESEAVAKQAG
jgi:uroporphyrinogen-III decarboxylase